MRYAIWITRKNSLRSERLPGSYESEAAARHDAVTKMLENPGAYDHWEVLPMARRSARPRGLRRDHKK